MMYGMGLGMGLFTILIPILVFGVGGVVLYRWYQNGRRRNAGSERGIPGVSKSTEPAIYRLAASHKGALTVSDVVLGLDLDAKTAENLLQSMVDYQRVRMEVSDEGKVVYEFPELLSENKKGDSSS